MSKDPAFLFYTSDFLTGVTDLTMEERGQFISLLCLQHQKGHLTKKMIDLCVGNAAADVMAKFRQDSAGLWYSPRLDEEIKKRAEHSEKQRKRALDGWEERRKNKKEKPQATADAAALPLEDEDVNEDESEISDRVKEGAETIRDEKVQEVISALGEKFGITEQVNFRRYAELCNFVTWLHTKKVIDNFIEQCSAYFKYKELSGESAHLFHGFIGKPENEYGDGGWCQDNWKHLLNNFKPKNNNGKSTAIEKRDRANEERSTELAELMEKRMRDQNNKPGS